MRTMNACGTWKHVLFPTCIEGPPQGYGRLIDIDVNAFADEDKLKVLNQTLGFEYLDQNYLPQESLEQFS
jgi:hypothetical protein